MKNLYLTDNGDLAFDGQNNIRMAVDDEELTQEIRLSFQENRGEYFLTPDDGFPRYDILGQKFDRERAIDAGYEVLLRNPRIDSVLDMEVVFDREKRKATYTFTAIKSSGEILPGEVVV